MIDGYFDTKAFMNALDAVREQRRLTWYQVWRETGIQLSHIKKMKTGKTGGPSIHTLSTLCIWSGVNPMPFMKRYEEDESMKTYRLVEIAPEDGTRHGKKVRTTLFVGPDKAAFLQALDNYRAQPRKPWAETFYYYGRDRVYAYEL